MEIKISREDHQKLDAELTKSARGIREWYTNLAAGPVDGKFDMGYIVTPQVQQLKDRLSAGTGGMYLLTGTQGVGKSATLRHIFYDFNPKEHSGTPDVSMFHWDSDERNRPTFDYNNPFFAWFDDQIELRGRYRRRLEMELGRLRFSPIKLPAGRQLPNNTNNLDIEWAEKVLGPVKCKNLRNEVLVLLLRSRKILLIDLPDYSRTDTRMRTRHISEISWLWDQLGGGEKPPTLVIAVQKEIAREHYFFDKMVKIEIQPLTADQLVASYERIFGDTFPFTETALATLAVMSRGHYRRFKRYVGLVIESHLQNHRSTPITEEYVREAITIERMVEDMNVELEQIFPKNPESRREAVRILFHLSESDASEQGKLADELEIPEYTLSRLLSRLELHRYITREPHGSQKIVRLTKQ